MIVTHAAGAIVIALVIAAGPVSGQSPSPATSPAVNAAAEAMHIIFGRKPYGVEEFDIVVTGLDGSGERTLLPAPHDVTRVSHDGTRIATVSFGTTLFPTILAADGSDPIELHPDPTLNLGAMAWSRDDEWMAFESWDDTDHERDGVYLLRADGTDLHRLTGPGIPGDFSPDDRQVVLSRDDGLFVVDVDGTSERQVGTIRPGPYPGYMPDGRSLYASDGRTLRTIDLASGEATPIEVAGGNAMEPRLSPDGTRFAFVFDPNEADSVGIWWMNVDGSGVSEVVNTPGTEEVFPDWLP